MLLEDFDQSNLPKEFAKAQAFSTEWQPYGKDNSLKKERQAGKRMRIEKIGANCTMTCLSAGWPRK